MALSNVVKGSKRLFFSKGDKRKRNHQDRRKNNGAKQCRKNLKARGFVFLSKFLSLNSGIGYNSPMSQPRGVTCMFWYCTAKETKVILLLLPLRRIAPL